MLQTDHSRPKLAPGLSRIRLALFRRVRPDFSSDLQFTLRIETNFGLESQYCDTAAARYFGANHVARNRNSDIPRYRAGGQTQPPDSELPFQHLDSRPHSL